MRLIEALGIQRGDVVSLVGAGGKTTAALRLADELACAGEKVLFTTTTRILEPIPAENEYLLLTEDEEEVLRRAPCLLEGYPKVIIAGRRLKEVDLAFLAGGEDDYPFPVRANKLKGIPTSLVDRLAEDLPEAVILVEADGARHRSLKAPADYEPVVPSSTTLLVPMAALDILGQPLTEEGVHRVRRVVALTGIAPGQPVTAEVVATVLSHPQGGLKGLSAEARAIPILNQKEARSPSAGAREVAHLLLECERIKRVVIASLRAPQPILEVVTAEASPSPQVAAIVLAAGASWRMGQPKQLLPLGEGTMLQCVIDTVLASPADAVIVVLGHRATEVAATIGDRPVQIIVNEAWEKGLSSSVKAGLRAAGTDIDAALFVLADQPAVSAEVMAQLIERYHQRRAPIVVPVYQNRRGNPVLFDRSLFAELMEMEGDQGGRDLINRYRDRVEEVEVTSEGVLLDIDTLADYRRLTEGDDCSHLGHQFSAESIMKSLTTIENLFIDMDGVLYHGNQVLPGAKEFIELLQEEGTPFLLLTNNSTLTRAQFVTKLRGMGIEVSESEILTSAQATALYLERIAPPGTRVYVVGEEGLRTALLDRGYEIVDNGADIVVVGMDRDVSYEKLKKATLAIRSGARFIATNPDRTFPAEEGIIPGAGALLAALEAATNVMPFVVGKPQPAIFDLARSKLGVGKEKTAVVGDRLETDILGGRNAGLITILLLSGVTTRRDLENSDLQPDFVFEDIRCLGKAWRKRR